MKRNFNQSFRDRSGAPIKPSSVEGAPPFKLRDAAMNALDGVYEDERQLSAEEKIRRNRLAQAIYDAGSESLEVTAEDVSLIKLLINKAYTAPLIVAQAHWMLEDDTPAAPTA